MSYKNPQISSFLVCRLRDSKRLRHGTPVPRKDIQSEYMSIKEYIEDSFIFACSLAKKYKCTVLLYSDTHHNYYPFSNYDPEINLLLK